MNVYAAFLPVYSGIILVTFIILTFLGYLSYTSMVYSLILANVSTGIIILVFFIRKFIHLEFDRQWADVLIKYSLITVVGGIAFVFYTNIDKILINMFMSPYDLGVYGAYSVASLSVTMIFSSIISNIFFPWASKYKDKKELFKKINRILPMLSVPLFVVFIISQIIVLFFFGSKYVMDPVLMILFGIAGVIIIADNIYGWMMNAVGKDGAKVTSYAAIILALSSIVLNYFFIPILGIKGAVITIILSYFISLLIIILRMNYYIKEGAFDVRDRHKEISI
jgi:O-antigen/teichoic acid export membrane protein